MEWLNPIIIATRIQSLDNVRFADLVNDILTETAARNRIDRSCIATNLRTTEPDGGIDARCTNSRQIVGQLIPRQNVDYQFKSGRETKTTALIVRDDILAKPRVMEGLANGHAFVYVAAWDRGDQTSEDLVSSLRDQGSTVENGQILFLGLDSLSRLLRAFPALIAKYLGAGSNLDSLDEWARYPRLNNPFKADEPLQGRVDGLRAAVEVEGSTLQVTGVPGEGKTRLVLEALRASELAPSVLYARQVEDVEPDLISYLKRTPDVRCTLVIDEVDDDNADRLIDRFSSRLSSDLRVVMIGLDAPDHPRQGTYRVPRPSQLVLYDAIKAIVPALPEEEARTIARDCDRSPKLAVLIASRIQENPSLVQARGFLGDGSVRSTLDRFLPLEGEAWRALRAISLLTRVGWTGNVEAESETLFTALGLDVAEARRHIESLHERYGVAPLAGRYRYVSPDVLADYSAAREIEPWTRARVLSVFGAFSPEMQNSFGLRIRRMSAILQNRTVIEEVILGDQGPFRKLDDLEANAARTLLRHLAGPFPDASLRALRRLIVGATGEELIAATRSRRDIVWALEHLLWREETFEDAANLLLRLALAENETWANSATGVWVESFQTVLGGTAAGLETRLRVLRRPATSANSRERVLAAKALEKALIASDMMVGDRGFPPDDVAGMPRKPWGPANYSEWADAFIAFLEPLQPLLEDGDQAVREAASEAIQTALSSTFHLPPKAFDSWFVLASGLTNADRDTRLGLVRAIGFACGRCDYLASGKEAQRHGQPEPDASELARRSEFFTARRDQLRELASRLAGTDFSIRFRSAVTQRERDLREDYWKAEEELENALEPYAHEAVADPSVLASEWEWLLEERNFRWSFRWIQVLGSVDVDRKLAPVLREVADRDSKAMMWRSLYELAYARARNDSGHVNRIIQEMIDSGEPGLQVFDLIFRAGYDPDRIRYLEHLLERGSIEPGLLANLAYRPWGPEIPPGDVIALIAAAVRRGSHLKTILPFLDTYLSQAEELIHAFGKVIVPVLVSAKDTELSAYEADGWMNLARRYVDRAPLEIANIALRLCSTSRLSARREYEVTSLISKAWEAADRQQFFEAVIAPWLEADSVEAWKVREELPGQPVRELPIDYLIEWVAQDPEKRAHRLAAVIGVPGNPPSDLHVALLQRFEEHGVGEEYYSKFVSGTFMGPMSNWIRSHIEIARHWGQDARPIVREWASKVRGSLEAMLKDALAREEEERFE
jgi:hypothetical protein